MIQLIKLLELIQEFDIIRKKLGGTKMDLKGTKYNKLVIKIINK